MEGPETIEEGLQPPDYQYDEDMKLLVLYHAPCMTYQDDWTILMLGSN